jgi:hypothetical protein
MNQDTIANLDKLCESIKSTKEGREWFSRVKEAYKPSFLKCLKEEPKK